jgi:hypothetical protein
MEALKVIQDPHCFIDHYTRLRNGKPDGIKLLQSLGLLVSSSALSSEELVNGLRVIANNDYTTPDHFTLATLFISECIEGLKIVRCVTAFHSISHLFLINSIIRDFYIQQVIHMSMENRLLCASSLPMTH